MFTDDEIKVLSTGYGKVYDGYIKDLLIEARKKEKRVADLFLERCKERGFVTIRELGMFVNLINEMANLEATKELKLRLGKPTTHQTGDYYLISKTSYNSIFV